MADRIKLTPQDLVFVHAMSASILTWSLDADWLKVTLREAAEALPHVNRDHPQLSALADAADMMLVRSAAAGRLEDRQALYRAGMNRAREALAAFFRWRLGEALEVVRAKSESAA